MAESYQIKSYLKPIPSLPYSLDSKCIIYSGVLIKLVVSGAHIVTTGSESWGKVESRI